MRWKSGACDNRGVKLSVLIAMVSATQVASAQSLREVLFPARARLNVAVERIAVEGSPGAGLDATIAALRPQWSRCYEKALSSNPGSRDRVELRLAIGADGQIAEVTATGADATLAGCAQAVARRTRFAPPGKDVTLRCEVWFDLAPRLVSDESVRTQVARWHRQLQSCRANHDRAPRAGVSPSRDFTVELAIAPTGRVTAANAAYPDDAVSACMARILRAVRVPGFAGGPVLLELVFNDDREPAR